MSTINFLEDLEFLDNKPATKLMLDTVFSKEIRIALKQNVVMKEHKAPFPIVIHLLKGKIDFGVEGKKERMTKGSMIALEANIAHKLSALEDSVVRLSVNKKDNK